MAQWETTPHCANLPPPKLPLRLRRSVRHGDRVRTLHGIRQIDVGLRGFPLCGVLHDFEIFLRDPAAMIPHEVGPHRKHEQDNREFTFG